MTSTFSSTAFAGKRALITGAAGGIGSQCARLLAGSGAELVLTDVNHAGLEQLAADLGTATEVTVLSGELTSKEGRTKLVKAAEELGGIDFLLPAAGIYPESPLTNITDEDWDLTIAVNLTSVFALIRDLVPHLKPGGSIVNFGSIAGARGSKNHSHYAASKGAIAAFTRSIAQELAERGIRANTIAPGIIATSMTDELLSVAGASLINDTPLHRLGTAEEVAGTAVFLCTDLAGFITGSTIHVNGGLHMAS